VLSLVSDRAKALGQLATQGLECLSMPDCFHVVHASIKSYALPLGRHLRHAHQELKTATEALARLQGRPHTAQDALEATAVVGARQAEMTRWEEAHHTSRCHLDTLSRTRPPCRMADSAPQTSAEVASHLQATVEAMDVCARCHQLPPRHTAMPKVRKPLPALAALVDFWGEGGRRDVEQAAISPVWGRGADECLLPLVYGEPQVPHTRCARRKAKIQPALEAMHVAFGHPALTQCLPPPALKEWQAWATHRVRALQRASSAVEGRNGALSQLHHHQRGLPKYRYKVWTGLHHVDCRAGDGTTPASRVFRRSLPDLFERVLSHIEALPRPRQRKQDVAQSH